MTSSEPLNVPPEPHAQDGTEHPGDAARRYAGEVWRLASGLADRGIPLDPDTPIDTAPVDAALGALTEAAEYRQIFELQWGRMTEATERWRAEAPDERALVMPDLGDLLRWLMDQADQAEAGSDRQAHADGYAKAVEFLRDDERYDAWCHDQQTHLPAPTSTRSARSRLAGYLEAVGEPRHPTSPAPGYRADGTPIGTLE